MINVSILIPCYNAERWVRQAVESALNQTYEHCEVICVDDGSTDGTLDLLLSFGDSIRLETGPNRGGNVTRNRLLKLAKGDWIQYLDADDYLEPTKVEGHIQTLENGCDADVLFGPVTIEKTLPSGQIDRFLDEIPTNEDPWNLFLHWGLPQTGGLFWNASVLKEVGGWKDDQPVCQENELMFRLLAAEKKFERSTGGAVYRIWSTETVCHRDPMNALKTRMQLVSAGEEWLEQNGRLTPEYRRTIAQTRLESARVAIFHDREYAYQLADQVRQKSPGFTPSPAPSFPWMYRWIYRCLGFGFSERVASWKRRLSTG